MRVPFDGFIGGAYEAQSWKAAAQRCVNWYVEQDPEKGKVLYPTPGLHLARALGAFTSDKQVLGMLATPNGLIFCTENNVFRATDVTFDSSGNATLTGITLLAAYGPSTYVVMAQAGDQFMIVNGVSGFYGYTNGAVVGPIIDTDFPAQPISCAAVDGYFLVHGATDPSKVQWSTPFDATSWDALDFLGADNLNDSVKRVIDLEREVYVVGEFSTEVWANVGGDDVFDRIAGTYIPYGTPASESVATNGQSLFWLAQDTKGARFIAQARGLQMSRLSTNAIDHQLSTYTTISDAYALTYTQKGHAFYCITFPTEEKTWCYDLSTQIWHERSSPAPGISTTGRIETHWSPRCHAAFAGANLVGGRNNPSLVARIYQLTPNSLQDENGPIVSIRQSPHVMNLHDYAGIDSVEFLFEPGAGVETGATAEEQEPQATLEISRDGGKTWGNARTAKIGRQGKYETRCKFNRLGTARDFVLRLSISAPVKRAITAAYLELG